MAKTQVKGQDIGDGSIHAVDINLSDAPTINSCSGSLYLAMVDTADNLTKIMTVDTMKAYLPYLPLTGGTLTGVLTVDKIVPSTNDVFKLGFDIGSNGYLSPKTLNFYDGNPTSVKSYSKLTIETTNTGGIELKPAPTYNVTIPTGNVGIGTTDPQYKLDVNCQSRFTGMAIFESALQSNVSFISLGYAEFQRGAGIYMYSANNADTFLVYNAGNKYKIDTGTITALTIQQDGNVGIGTSTPSTKLQVSAGNSSYNTTTAPFSIQKNEEGYGLFAGVNHNGNSWLQSGVKTNNVWYDLVLQPNGGNVGIGTTTPTQKLDINGTLRIRTLTEKTSYPNVLVADANGNIDYVLKSSLGGGGSYISNQFTAAQTGSFWISGFGKLNQLLVNSIYADASGGLTIGGDPDTFTGIYLLSDVKKVIIQPNGEESYFGVYLQNNDFCPVYTDTVSLGTKGNRWNYIYAFNAYANQFEAFSPDTNDGCSIGNAGITGQLYEGGVYGRNGDEMIAVMAFEEIMLQNYHNYYYANGSIHVREYNSTYLFSYLNGAGTRAVTVDSNGVLGTTALGIVGYPASGIAVSTGTAWGTSITNNSANWNTAYGWGNHASAGYAAGNHTHNYDNYISWSVTGGGTGYQVLSGRVINFDDTATIEVESSYANDEITLKFNMVGSGGSVWTRVTGATPYLVPATSDDDIVLNRYLYINSSTGNTTALFASSGIRLNSKDSQGATSSLWFDRTYVSGTANGDLLGRIFFTGNYSSTQAHTGLDITVTAKGTWGASTAPTQIDFLSGRDGSATTNRRITFDKDGYVIINEDGVGMNFRIEGDNDSSLFETNGNNDMVGIGCGGSIDTKLHIQTPSNWGNTVLKLEQGDTSKAFIDFVGSSGTGFSNSISSIQGTGVVAGPKRAGGSVGNTGWYFVRMIAINVNGALEWIATYGAETNGT